jgi:hypothetical protein
LTGGRGANKKTHDCFQPWVFVEIFVYSRQAPTAGSLTTTTSSGTCRTVNIRGKRINQSLFGQARLPTKIYLLSFYSLTSRARQRFSS